MSITDTIMDLSDLKSPYQGYDDTTESGYAECYGDAEPGVHISLEWLKAPNFTKPKARPNRYLSRNARKAHQRNVQAHQRTKAMERQLVDAITTFTNMRLRERSFFEVLMGSNP